uniref:Uncharacterized protein n=1 Tax=Leersia perrieri TaxID=77586 RepID=A0A0D9WUG1_9ORYZ
MGGMGGMAMALLLLLLFAGQAQAQSKGVDQLLSSLGTGNDAIVATVMNDQLKNLTHAFSLQMGKELHYCIKDTGPTKTSLHCC